MGQYFVTYTTKANIQLDAIYTDKRAYINGSHFTDRFKRWSYRLLQYLRPSTFYKAKARGIISMGSIGDLDYYIMTVKGINVVVITSFYFKSLPFTSTVNKYPKKVRQINDAGYGFSIVQDLKTQKVAIRKPDKRLLTRFGFDDIIGFHHSAEDYNKIHANGFIGDRVYEILKNGDIALLHISKEDYLSMKHRYDEIRRRINRIVETVIRQISREELLENPSNARHKKRPKIRLTERDLYGIIKECVNKTLASRCA